MKLKYFIGIPVFIGFVFLATAHEYWMAPSKYQVKKAETFTFNCYVGEDFTPQIWAKRKERTGKVTRFHLNEVLDITPAFVEKDSVNIIMALNQPGEHLITMQSKPSYIEMEGAAFNAYLKEDGMTNVFDYRIANKQEGKRSREFYQRCAKTLIEVDGKKDETYKMNCGMVLEIIPQSNPYEIKNELPVYFEFKGKALANYQVRTWCKKNGKLVNKSFYTTNEKGVAVLPVKESGEWMISLVKMEILKNNEKADYESYWGSYTFYKK